MVIHIYISHQELSSYIVPKYILFKVSSIFLRGSYMTKWLMGRKVTCMVCSSRLSLNISKTNYMFFGNRILKTHVSIHISKEEITHLTALEKIHF